MGERVTLPDGREVDRLQDVHKRRFVSIFGTVELTRTVYGSREGQKIEFVPLDNRVQLPESAFSYVLQDWDRSFCVEQAFGPVSMTIERILDLRQSVDSVEHMNKEMAKEVTNFMLNRPQPEEEGEIVVSSVDQNGIVMRRQTDDPPAKAHRTKGDKASQKRMATVTTVFSVDRYCRTPEPSLKVTFVALRRPRVVLRSVTDVPPRASTRLLPTAEISRSAALPRSIARTSVTGLNAMLLPWTRDIT